MGGAVIYFMCTFSQGFFFPFSPLLEGTWVHGTWISLGVSSSAPLFAVGLMDLLRKLDSAPLNPSPYWKNVEVGLGFPMGGFPKAQAGLEFNLKELVLLGLTFRSLGSQSIVLATDPVPEVGWMIFDVNIGWQSRESEGFKPVDSWGNCGLEFRPCIKSQVKMHF